MTSAREATIAATLAALVCLGCSKNAQPTRERDEPTREPEGVSVTASDWETAQKIAESSLGQKVEKHSDGLPFLFKTSGAGGKSVLVHRGKVVNDRGPQALADYLRDIGAVAGPGPKPGDLLIALRALEAFPTVDNAYGDTRYIHTPDNPKLASLSPRIERGEKGAAIVLHYPTGSASTEGERPAWTDEPPETDTGDVPPPPPPPPPEPDGELLPGQTLPEEPPGGWGTSYLDVARMTLAIPPSPGPTAWKRQDIEVED
jgi:hypothetical protein